MKSIWSKGIELKNYTSLKGDIKAHTVVIGGGIAGILTAYRLKEKGIKAIIIEAKTICSGQTKNTTAKITSQHGAIYNKIISNYGEKAARQYAAANEKAISEYEQIIEKHNIDCHFERKNAILYSVNDSEIIKKEAEAAKRAGINCYVTNKTELPFPVKAALVFRNQAQFNPLEFLSAIADNLKIYENTSVTKIADNIVYTENGTVTAENIIFACHYPFVNFPGLYFLRMSQERSYVVSSKWNGELTGMSIDAGKGLSFREYKNEILIGGGAHRTGKTDKSNPFDMLIKKGKMMFSDFNETAEWSAQDCITLDGIPYIGRLSAAAPNIFVATGFNKWGMTSAMVGADIISDMICGGNTSAYSVFSPSRFSIFAAAKNLCTNTKETARGFAKHLKQANYKAENIKTGTAGIIKYQGKKAGAYRDENGKLYIVSLTCPHLKCELEWNDTTKTWDCPCHGSRYDYQGRLVDNPAQQNSILIN